MRVLLIVLLTASLTPDFAIDFFHTLPAMATPSSN